MPSFLDQLLQDVPSNYIAPDASATPVTASPEFQRVFSLPRRTTFRTTFTPQSLGGTLFPIQVAALGEARECQGLLAPVGCGEGKTLVTMLLHSAIDAGGRSVLLIPASMEPQLFSEYERFKKLFILPVIHPYKELCDETEVCVLRYSTLSNPRFFDALERIRPKLFICDEAHYLKVRQSVRTRRFLQYFKKYPETLFCGLSGTITSNSLQDFAHLAKLALRKGAPVPLSWPILTEWSEALDANLIRRRPAGALMSFCGGGESAIQGYQRRLTETPGVVASNKNNVKASLVISRRKLQPTPKIKEALDNLRETWTTPSGEEIADAMEMSRKAREIACGFYYRWAWEQEGGVDWEWLTARTEWHREVRAKLHRGAVSGLDSEHLLEAAAARGDWKSVTYARWAAVKGRELPPVLAVWLDPYLVKDAVAFGREAPSIIWTRHDAVGEAIAREGGWPLFNGGVKNDRALLTVTGKETIVCSVAACGTGKNLQMFNRQLITSPMSGGLGWEQLLARTHREGQMEDQVTADVYLHTPENMRAFKKAQSEAQFQQDLEGAQKRLCMATVLL
jgi:hypothetical protein